MGTISAEHTQVVPKDSTVGLPAALAIGAAAVVAAFGGGYGLAQWLDDPIVATAGTPHTVAGDTFGIALTESLALKQGAPVGKAADIRFKRIR